MKQFIFTETLGPLIAQYHPGIIVETGTHSGRSATFMCTQALQYRPDVTFHGFDLFDLASDDTHQSEINGKGTGNYDKAHARLSGLASKYPEFSFRLYKGFTTDTLVAPIQADLVYIDGGHSTDTVIHDWSMVRHSRVIVFDDFQLDSVKQAVAKIGLIDQIRTFAFGKTQQAIWEQQ
jgi:predicted O-methyltransferase YrrM